MPVFERWQGSRAANPRRSWKCSSKRCLSLLTSVAILLLGTIGDAAAFTEEDLEDPDSDRVAELLGSDDPLHPIYKSVVRRAASAENDIYDDPDEPIVEFDDTGSPIIPVGQCYDSGGINFKRIPASTSSESSEGNGDPQPGEVPPTPGKSGTGSGFPDNTTVRPTALHAGSSEEHGDPRLGDVPPISSTSRKGAGLADRTTTSRPSPLNSITSSASGTDSGGLPGSTTFLPTVVTSISSSSSGAGPGLPESTTFLPTPVHSVSTASFSAVTETAQPLISSTTATLTAAFVDIFVSYLPPPTEKPSPSTSSAATITATAGYRRERNEQASPSPTNIPSGLSFHASDVTGIRLDGDRLSVSEEPELESEDFQRLSSPKEASSTQRPPTARGLTFALGFLTRAPQTPASLPPPKLHQEIKPPPATSPSHGSPDYYDDYDDYENNNSIAIAHEEFEIHGHEGIHVIDDDDETASNFSAFGTRCEHFDIPALELLVPGKRNYTVIPWIATTPPSVLKSKLSDASPGARSLNSSGSGIEEFLRNELFGSPQAPIKGNAVEFVTGNLAQSTEMTSPQLLMANVTKHPEINRTVAPTHSTFTKHASPMITTFTSQTAFTQLAQTKPVHEQTGTSAPNLDSTTEGPGHTEALEMGISVTLPSESFSDVTTDNETTTITAAVPLTIGQTAGSAHPEVSTTPWPSASKPPPSSATVPDIASTIKRLITSPSTTSQDLASTKLVSMATSETDEDIQLNGATTPWASTWNPSSSSATETDVASTMKRRIPSPSTTTSPDSISTTSSQKAVSSFGHSVPHGSGNRTRSPTPFGITAATPSTEETLTGSNAVLANAIDFDGDVPAVSLHRSQIAPKASIAELLLDNTALQVANQSSVTETVNASEQPTSTDLPNTHEAVVSTIKTTNSKASFTHEQTSPSSKLTTASISTAPRFSALPNKSTQPDKGTAITPQAPHLPTNATETEDVQPNDATMSWPSAWNPSSSATSESNVASTVKRRILNPSTTSPNSVSTTSLQRSVSSFGHSVPHGGGIQTPSSTPFGITAATPLTEDGQARTNAVLVNAIDFGGDVPAVAPHRSQNPSIASIAELLLDNTGLQAANESLESEAANSAEQSTSIDFPNSAGNTPEAVIPIVTTTASNVLFTHEQTRAPSKLTTVSSSTLSRPTEQQYKSTKPVEITENLPQATHLPPQAKSRSSALFSLFNETEASDIGSDVHRAPAASLISIAASFFNISDIQVTNGSLAKNPEGPSPTSSVQQTTRPINHTRGSTRQFSRVFPNVTATAETPSIFDASTAATVRATELVPRSQSQVSANSRLLSESEVTSNDVGSNIHQSPESHIAGIASSFLDNSGQQAANETLESVGPLSTAQPDLRGLQNQTGHSRGRIATTFNTRTSRLLSSTQKRTNSPSKLTTVSTRTVSQFPSQPVKPSKPASSTASTPQATELPLQSRTQFPVNSMQFNESVAADIGSNVHRSSEASIISIAASFLDVSELQETNGSIAISSMGPPEHQVYRTVVGSPNSSLSPVNVTAPTAFNTTATEATVQPTSPTVNRHLRLEGSTFPSSVDSFSTHAAANITPQSFETTSNPPDFLQAENKKINCTNVTLLVAVISRPKLVHLLATSTAPNFHSTLGSQEATADTHFSQRQTTPRATVVFTQKSKSAQFLATEEPFALELIEPQAELHLSPPIQLSQALAVVPYAESITLEPNTTGTAVHSNQPGYPVITAQINATGVESQRTTPKGPSGITFRFGSETPVQKQSSRFDATTTSQPEIKSTSTASKQQGKPTGWTEVFGERTASFTTASPSAPTIGSARANVTSRHTSTLSRAGNSNTATVGPYGQEPLTGPIVGWDLTTAKEFTVVPLSVAHFTSASTELASGPITSRGVISNHTISTHVMPAQAFTRDLSHLSTPTVPPNGLEGPAGTASAPFMPNVTLAAERNTTAYTDEDSPSTVKYRLPSDNGVFLAIPLVVAVSSAEIDSESPQSVKSKPGQPAFAIATVSPNPIQPANNVTSPPAFPLSANPPGPIVPYPYAGYGQPAAIPSGYGLPSPYGPPPSGGYGGYGGYGGIGAPNPNYFNEYRPPDANPGVLGAVAPAVGPISGYEQESAFVDLTPKPNYGVGGRPILPVTDGYGSSPRTSGYGLEVDVEAYKYQPSRPVFAAASENPNPYGPGPSSLIPAYASPPTAQPPITLPNGNGYPTQSPMPEHPGTKPSILLESSKQATGNSNPYETAPTSASSGPVTPHRAKFPTPQPPGGDGYPGVVPTTESNNSPDVSKTVPPQGSIISVATTQPADKTSPTGKTVSTSTVQPPTTTATADVNRKPTTVGVTAGYPGAVTAVISPSQKPSPVAFTFRFGGEPSPATTAGNASNHPGTAFSVGPSGPPPTKHAYVAEPARTTSGNTTSNPSNVITTTSARPNATPFEFTFRLGAQSTTTSTPAEIPGYPELTSKLEQPGPPTSKQPSTAQTASTTASGSTVAYPGVVPVVSSTPSKPSPFEFSFRFGGETTTSSPTSESSKYPGSASSVISKSYSPSPPAEAYFLVPKQGTASTIAHTNLPAVPSRPSMEPQETTLSGNPYLPPASATGKQFETITSTTNSQPSASESSPPVSPQATSIGHASTPSKWQSTESPPFEQVAATTTTPLAILTLSTTSAPENSGSSTTPQFWAVSPSPSSPRTTLDAHTGTLPLLQPTVSSTSAFAQLVSTTITPLATAVSSTTQAFLPKTEVATLAPTTPKIPAITQAEHGTSPTQPFWVVRPSPALPQGTSSRASTSPQLQSTEPSTASNAQLLETTTTTLARFSSLAAPAALPNITSASTTQEVSVATQAEYVASPTLPFWAARQTTASPRETSVSHPSTSPQLQPSEPTQSPSAQLLETTSTPLTKAPSSTAPPALANITPTAQEVPAATQGENGASPTQPFWAVRHSSVAPHETSVSRPSTSSQLQPTEPSNSPFAQFAQTTITPLVFATSSTTPAPVPNTDKTFAPTTLEVPVVTQGEYGYGVSPTQPFWAIRHSSPVSPNETSAAIASTSPPLQLAESSPSPIAQLSPTTSTLLAIEPTSTTPGHLSSIFANSTAPTAQEVPAVTQAEFGTTTQPFWSIRPTPESPHETPLSRESTPPLLTLTVSSAAPFAQLVPTTGTPLPFVSSPSATYESLQSNVDTTSAPTAQTNSHPPDESFSGTSPLPTGYQNNAPNTPATSYPSTGNSNPYEPRVPVATQGGYELSPTQPFWAIRPPSPSPPIDILQQSYLGGALTTGQPPPWVNSTGSSLLTKGPEPPPTGSQYSAQGPTTQPNPYGGSPWPSSFTPSLKPQTPTPFTAENAATSKSTTAPNETITKASVGVAGATATDITTSLPSSTANLTGQPPATASTASPSKLQLIDTAAPPLSSETTPVAYSTSKPIPTKPDKASAATSERPTTAGLQSNITSTGSTSHGSSTKLPEVAATTPTAGSRVTLLEQASSTPVPVTISKPTQTSLAYSRTTARPISAERLPPSKTDGQAYGPVAPPHPEATAVMTVIGPTLTTIRSNSLATAGQPRTDVPPAVISPPSDNRGNTPEAYTVSLSHATETITGGWIVLTPRSKTTKEPIGTTLYLGSLSTISQPYRKTTESSSRSAETAATTSRNMSPPQLSTASLSLQGLTTLDSRARTAPSSFSPPLSSLRQRTSLSTSSNVHTTEALPPEDLPNPYDNNNLPATTPAVDLIGQHPPAVTQLIAATTSLPNPTTTSSNLVSASAPKSNIDDLRQGKAPPKITQRPLDHSEELIPSSDGVATTTASSSTANTASVVLTQGASQPSIAGIAGGPPGPSEITHPQPDITSARPLIPSQVLTTQPTVSQPQQPAAPYGIQNIPAWPSAPPPIFEQQKQLTLATIPPPLLTSFAASWQQPFAPPAVETIRPSPIGVFTLLPLAPTAPLAFPPENNVYGPVVNVGVFPANPAPTLQPYIPPRQPEPPSVFPSPPPALPAGPPVLAVLSYSGYGPAPSSSDYGLPAPYALPPPPSPVVVDSYGGSGSSYPSGGYAQSSNGGSGYGGGPTGYGEARSGYGPQAGLPTPRPYNDGSNRGVPIAPYANWPATPRTNVFYGSLAPNSYQNAAPPRLPGGQPDYSNWWQWGKARYGRRRKRYLTLSKLIM